MSILTSKGTQSPVYPKLRFNVSSVQTENICKDTGKDTGEDTGEDTNNNNT